MSRQQFSAYLRDVHGEIATRNPLQLSAYVQNHVVDSITGEAPLFSRTINDRDAVIELRFEGMPQLGATMTADYTREVVGPDGRNFSDLPSAIAVLTDDVVSGGGTAETKTFTFLYAADGVGLDAFVDSWRAARDRPLPIGATAVTFHERKPEGDELLKYFGGAGMPEPAGVVSIRFETSEGALEAARDFVVAPHADPAMTTTLLTRELVIFQKD
jgi:hypothetical protein